MSVGSSDDINPTLTWSQPAGHFIRHYTEILGGGGIWPLLYGESKSNEGVARETNLGHRLVRRLDLLEGDERTAEEGGTRKHDYH